jgi:anaerobic selenocysteine-containing dehydrogenase
MHPDDAATRDLADGAEVRLVNSRGEVTLTLRVDLDVRPGVVSVPKGLWRRHGGGGPTVNVLCPDDLEPTAGGACFNDARVDVKKSGS